jgi:SSS family solute:Na+ symporter
MATRIAVAAAYFSILFLIGLVARTRQRGDASQYFLAGRSLRTPLLLMTMAATNFSAFTVFGASGAGYRDGLAFLPVMAFGTGFMALTFWLIGRKVWQYGQTHDLITPAELVRHRYSSGRVATLVAVVLVVFTVPYLALQPMAAGTVLGQMFGLPHWVGALAVTVAIVLYTMRGGMRAVAWTDAFQGMLLLSVLLVALALVVSHHGGWNEAFAATLDRYPALFSRPGLQGVYTPAIWFSFLALWFFCDPMFPQLFQRFYAARDERALGRTMLVYPLICTVVFAPPILIGMLGRLSAPGLTGKEADGILALVMTGMGSDLMGALVLTAGLAALMSTMDSQLLTLSSIVSRDLLPRLAGGRTPGVATSRLLVLLLAAIGLLVALTTDATILELGVTAFTGFAVLFPTVLFGLYLDKPRPAAALASIISGEATVVAYHLGLLPTFGFLSAVPAMACATIVYLAVHFATGPAGLPHVTRTQMLFIAAFGAVFLLAQDYWRWGETGPVVLGLPAWCWYFAGLSATQMIVTGCLLKKTGSLSPATPHE